MNQKPPLTSSELACVWTSYLQNSMSICVMEHFLDVAEDSKTIAVIQNMHNFTSSNTQMLNDFFTEAEVPLPSGFSEEDVHLNVDRLFDDTFILAYLYRMSKIGMLGYSTFQAMVVREDLSVFYSLALKHLSDLHNECNQIMLEKGAIIRPPYMPLEKTTEMIQDKSYFSGLSPFHENRPLNAIEIGHLHENIQTNMLGKMLCTGFAQTAQLQSVRDYMFRGAEIAKKHVKTFSEFLSDSNINEPISWDTQVSTSEETPFSDKLMMFHIQLLSSAGIGNYAAATAVSMRNDIRLAFSRLALEVSQYAEDGAKLMIKNRWLAEPPQMIDREKIKNRG